MFSERSSHDEKGEKLQIDYILEYFSKFPIALQKYLEFLIFEEKIEVLKQDYYVGILTSLHVTS